MTTIPAGLFDFLNGCLFRSTLPCTESALKERLDLSRQGLHVLRAYQFVFPAWKKHA
jgi:hypothetical protein